MAIACGLPRSVVVTKSESQRRLQHAGIVGMRRTWKGAWPLLLREMLTPTVAFRRAGFGICGKELQITAPQTVAIPISPVVNTHRHITQNLAYFVTDGKGDGIGNLRESL